MRSQGTGAFGRLGLRNPVGLGNRRVVSGDLLEPTSDGNHDVRGLPRQFRLDSRPRHLLHRPVRGGRRCERLRGRRQRRDQCARRRGQRHGLLRPRHRLGLVGPRRQHLGGPRNCAARRHVGRGHRRCLLGAGPPRPLLARSAGRFAAQVVRRGVERRGVVGHGRHGIRSGRGFLGPRPHRRLLAGSMARPTAQVVRQRTFVARGIPWRTPLGQPCGGIVGARPSGRVLRGGHANDLRHKWYASNRWFSEESLGGHLAQAQRSLLGAKPNRRLRAWGRARADWFTARTRACGRPGSI